MADSTSNKRGRGCLLAMAAAVASVLIATAVIYVLWSRAAEARLANELADLRASEIPTTSGEIDAYYQLPRSENNVAPMWHEAIKPLTGGLDGMAERLPLVGENQDPIPPPGQPWDQLEAVEALLEHYAESMQLLHEAAAKGPMARFERNFADGFAMRLPHVQDLRAGARMLSLEAHVRAHQGDAHGAAQSIRTCFRLSRALDYDPVVVSQLVRVAIGKMALNLISDQLPYTQFSDEDLQLLQATIREVDYRDGIRRGLVGERVIALETSRNPKHRAGESDGIPRFIGAEDLSMYLQLMKNMIHGVDEGWVEGRIAAAAAAEEAHRLAASITKFRYIMTTMSIPSLEIAINAGARAQAYRDSVDAVIAVVRYQRARGELPESLNDLIPDYLARVPEDPFDGEPLRYRVDKSEVLIYSVGPDEKDDGGQTDARLEPDIAARFRLID